MADNMEIVRADAMGMCFGVRDALQVIDQVARPEEVTIHGELVHNREVLRMLDARGFRQSDEASRGVPETPAVLVTAHGISDRERARLRNAGKALVDTTCPLVQKVHDAAQALQRDGRRVVVIGRPGHVEVRGIVEDLTDPVVVWSADDVRAWAAPRLGVVCQTTAPHDHVEALLDELRRQNPRADVEVVDTVCSPTKARAAALDALLPRIDALVVVGGRSSNNTRQLVVRAERRGVPALHVERADELSPAWFEGREVVGLTAGTSTLPATVDDVHARLREIASQRGARAARRRSG